mmetsp:Transcript_6658/g.5772  ORF Transcript_6658/g.5772 Transcript_6658/m.5772 type:complete len:124 (+) Transcript_6658:182-553(+)
MNNSNFNIEEDQFNYFNDKLLKFKLMKVKKTFEPTYQMGKEAGEKMREKIIKEAKNEMDTIISNNLKQSISVKKPKKSRKKMPKKQNEGSSDSTSEGSGPFVSQSVRGGISHIKNKIIRIKQK